MSEAAEALRERARAWGVETSWHDVEGTLREVPADTLEAVLEVLSRGHAQARPPGEEDGPLVLSRHQLGDTVVPGPGVLRTEDGEELHVEGTLPADTPPGYHRLLLNEGGERAVVVGPGRCHLPAELRTWGWAVQLYSLRSAASWGMGDLGDLRELAAWARSLGAGTLLLNPLHFSTPLPPVEASPYSPGSRRFRNPVYLRVEGTAGVDLAALRTAPLIDRDAVLAAKLEALAARWASRERGGGEAFARWREQQGADLEDFGTWCALAELHGADWREWPQALRDRGSAAVAEARARHADRAAFHAWLQWLLDEQLEAAGGELRLLHDLAIGVHPGGVDAWLTPEVMAPGVSVGAPPDAFNSQGQDWGILPFDPWRLRAAGHAPFVAMLRACLRGAGGLRVDHVMGLSRLYWIPPGASPAEGAYVRYPRRELFEILALESVRAGALVVGEDLGTVEPAVREEMAARDVLSYRLLWFEQEPPERQPERALAAVTTHDLPTVAGLWSGADLADQLEAGTHPDAEEYRGLREHLRRVAGLGETADREQAVLGAYAALARAPSRILMATLEDALCVERRPNLPGTTGERRPNWCLPLPHTLEEIRELSLPRRLARLLRRDG